MADTVLVVEDDADIVELLTLYLQGSGFAVLTAANGLDGLAILRSRPVDAVLADLMLPAMNGYDFIRTARTFSDVPVIIVSARSQAADKTLGLDAGADGYITKPFDGMEVVAYVNAVLRRYRQEAGPAPQDGSLLVVGPLELDTERLVLRKNGEMVPLTAAETKIMLTLMRHPGRVFSKAQLYEAASGEAWNGSDGTVMVHISNIRGKIEDDPGTPSLISTVWGLGYRLEAE